MDEAGEAPRSRLARRAAEAALVRVVHHYGAQPEFVVLGGLVPELLCAGSAYVHAGTTDVDVQVDLEIARGASNAVRLEGALRNAEFEPDGARAWRWTMESDDHAGTRLVVKFELLADRPDERAPSTILFTECEHLGAANLRGTGFAARDARPQRLRARIGDVWKEVDVKVTGLAGFLLAKVAAAHARAKPKDWYDIAFVLLHNHAGGPEAASRAVMERFGSELGSVNVALRELAANFSAASAQGPRAYVEQMRLDHPDLDALTLAADAMLAVAAFLRGLRAGGPALSG